MRAKSTSRDRSEPKRLNKHQQIAMLTTLQRCSQIPRDDKAQLRRRIRELDEEILAVFSRYRKPINYQALQADLRRIAVKMNCNKENIPVSYETENRGGSLTYRLPKKKNSSTKKFPDRKESLTSNHSRKTVNSSRKTEVISPKNSWFSKLQHKLKFKNQVKQDCIPVDQTTTKPVTPKHCQIEQQFHRKPNCTKQIKERILDRQKYNKLEIGDMEYRKQQPKVSLPTPQQESLMFSFKNDLRLSLHQSNRQDFVQNISSLDVSPGRQSYSLNDTERKLIHQLQPRKSHPKPKPRLSIVDSSTLFTSSYSISPTKIQLLKELSLFKHRYAEDLLTYFFESPRKLLSRQDFYQLMMKLLQELEVQVRSFETMEQFVTLIIGEEAFITPVMLGNALELVAMSKNCPVRLVYGLLNSRGGKVLAIEDMLNYVNSAVKGQEQKARAEYLCYELLYLCSKDGRLSYWDLYLARESPQFVQLCNLLTC